MAMGVKNLVIAFFHKCFAIVLTNSQDRTECQSVRYLKQSSTQLLKSFLRAESETDPVFYSLHFMEPESSSPLLKTSDACPYSEPHQSMTISIFLKIRFNNILPSNPGSFSQISSPKPHVPLCCTTYVLHAPPTSFLFDHQINIRRWTCCYHSVQNLLSSSLLSKNIKIIHKYNFACCFVWVWNLVAQIEGGM